MNYKPDHAQWMAYLYNELEGEERLKIEQYINENPEARQQLEEFKNLRSILSHIQDEEVIAPPVLIRDNNQRSFWDTPYIKTILSVAAACLLLIIAGKLTGLSVKYTNNEVRIGFGEAPASTIDQQTAALSQAEVQAMIDQSIEKNVTHIQQGWQDSQTELNDYIKHSLATTNGKIDGRIDDLVRAVSLASQEQINLYVAGLQSENLKMMKDYMQLTSAEQSKYVENLLVDFSKYLQQQRNADLQMMHAKLSSIEKNTDIFKEETEQILSSIITRVDHTPTTNY